MEIGYYGQLGLQQVQTLRRQRKEIETEAHRAGADSPVQPSLEDDIQTITDRVVANYRKENALFVTVLNAVITSITVTSLTLISENFRPFSNYRSEMNMVEKVFLGAGVAAILVGVVGRAALRHIAAQH